MVQPSGSEVICVAGGVEVASVTGQTVVPMATTEVMVRAGQFVTVGAHDVMVDVKVV